MNHLDILITGLADIADEADRRGLYEEADDVTSLLNLLTKYAEISKRAYIEAVKVKGKTKYKVRSEKNKDWSGGVYPTKEQAEKRLAEVEMFKHMKKKKSSK